MTLFLYLNPFIVIRIDALTTLTVEPTIEKQCVVIVSMPIIKLSCYAASIEVLYAFVEEGIRNNQFHIVYHIVRSIG